MSELYTSLDLSPKKKRCRSGGENDETSSPKKLCIRHELANTPSKKAAGSKRQTEQTSLPDHISRLSSIHTALQRALTHALASCAVAPNSDTGIIRNVLNHLSLASYSGLSSRFDVDDLNRLCWLWEWDGKTARSLQGYSDSAKDDENPFLDEPKPTSDNEWTRGAMGIVISPGTHFSKSAKKRVPAYGVGIEVEMDIDKDMTGGMAAVARWTAASEQRYNEFRDKLEAWVKLHEGEQSIPQIPSAGLPSLPTTTKVSTLTRTLASASPKSGALNMKFPAPPSSPSRSPAKLRKLLDDDESTSIPFRRMGSLSPVKYSGYSSGSVTSSPQKTPVIQRILPFPSIYSSPEKKRIFPGTPSRRGLVSEQADPTTPSHQKGSDASTAPQTPTSSRRQALYERIRQKSLSATPSKSLSSEVKGGSLSRDQLAKMGQEEMRRRCLLGRLSGVADSVWMLFSTPMAGSSTASTTPRKRRALPTSEVSMAVVKSSPVPISVAEANESLSLLAKLCPFFLKELNIGSQEWLEMPATQPPVGGPTSNVSPAKLRPMPASPGRFRGKNESAKELINRSPKRVKWEAGGLREVREIIRRELELLD